MLKLSSKSELQAYVNQGNKVKYVCFWGHQQSKNTVSKACFSQWYASTFTENGIQYLTSEHYMMAEKARLFEPSCVDMILASKTTKEVKLL
ncbi:NADAR family protein, partial [Candidatus Albibeggiatoa sp. nov. BB20]|uniref:NADAR family protein n=1 Tax=Candidatus Albibeggiatoa sp. nov. BB20 TaxID=3162723 RepID=UPI003365850E